MNPSRSETVSLTARVAEVLEEGGQSHLKILADPFYISIIEHGEVHLGDQIQLEARIQSIRLTQASDHL